MPITKSAKKALKQNRKKRLFNVRRLRAMKSGVKEVRELVGKQNLDEAKAKLSAAYKALDKAAKKGVIKKNTANRKKSRLARAIKKAESVEKKN